MGFAISPLHTVWDYRTLERKLIDLADSKNLFNRNCYIKSDLSVGFFDRNSVPFKVGQFFRLTDFLHDIDYEKSKKIFLELKPQIERTNNNELISTFKQALKTFNDKAPKRYSIEFVEPVRRRDKDSEEVDSIAYRSPAQRKDPPLLKRLPFEFFSNEFLTNPEVLKKDVQGNFVARQLVQREQIAEAYRYSAMEQIVDFEKVFVKYLINSFQHLDVGAGVWDVHDICFQNLALKLTSSLSDEELRSPKTQALRHLIRARNFAIGSRNDISWNGKPLAAPAEKQQKQEEMEAHWRSIVLRDWEGLGKIDSTTSDVGAFAQKISVTREDTQTAVERMSRSYSSEHICWLNMSRAHKIGGSYQNLGMGQEEETVTNSDAMVVLSNLGKPDENGEIIYQDHLHIPPGGNYFHKMRFITGSQVSCNSIVQAFADFRDLDYGEEQDYVDMQGKLDVGSEGYKKRIKLDMRGVLRTAVEEGQEVLILGATGCGMCGHDPRVEARAWKEVLSEKAFEGRFKEVVFAIVDDPRKASYASAFREVFQ